MERPTTPIRRRADRYLNQPPEKETFVPSFAASPDPKPAAPEKRLRTDRPTAPYAAEPQRDQRRPARPATPIPDDRRGTIERGTPAKGMLQSGTAAGVKAKPQAKKSGARKKKPKEEEWQRPVWMKVCTVLALLAILACMAGEMLMQAYLTQQQRDREAAARRIVNAHPLQFADAIETWSDTYGLQPAFVASIILNESSYNTRAESGVGARGLMQLMPDTAAWIAHKLGMDEVWNDDMLWDAETNIRFGCWYLSYLSRLFQGDAVTVASAYHTGQGQVSTWLQNAAYAPDGKALSLTGMPDGPTKTYAGRVTRDYGIYDKLYFHAFNEADADT